jgi:hypothetical protein
MVELALIVFSGVSFILGIFVGVSEERRRSTKVASSASANSASMQLPPSCMRCILKRDCMAKRGSARCWHSVVTSYFA